MITSHLRRIGYFPARARPKIRLRGAGVTWHKCQNQRTQIMPDFIPPADPAKIIWLTNLKTKIAGYAVTFGLSAARVAQLIAWCDDLIAKINAAAQAKRDWLAASAEQATQEKASLAGIRGEVAQWKPNPNMTAAITADLKLMSTAAAFNPDTYKALITSAEAFSGYNRLKFQKGGVGSVNFYWRKVGETVWRFLARDTNSPYDDHTPATTPGGPEVREYLAFGVVNDVQIGLPSDIVTVTFGG